MNYINRHNYETIFLLYVDNELSAAEKNAVDEFVILNPDLEEELVMLQQSILKPENLVFMDKDSLLKNGIKPAGMQEQLLRYIDNELNSQEKKKLDLLISSDAGVKKEWNLLQQTVLSPDAIFFADKRSLYRTEGSKVILLTWRKIAVAAVFIGFGLWGTIAYLNKRPVTIDKEIAVKPVNGNNNSAKKVKTVVIPAPVEKNIATESQTAISPVKKTIHPGLNKKKEIAVPDEMLSVNSREKNNNLPKPYSENINKDAGNKGSIAGVIPAKPDNNIVHPGNNEIVKADTQEKIASPANVFAANTSFTDNSRDNDDNVPFFEEEEKTKKTKLGGLFRKVKRVLERNTSIKTGGKNLKVANLEFAIQ